ncbi:MAG: hypothetical protein J6S83_15280 [Lachnospiraceae bacterium]|nr:hypothetical protein [Lachnospiraceae bacterium]
MKKRGLLFASVMIIGMGMSMPAWAGEAPAQPDEGIGGLLSSLFSDDGMVQNLLGGDGSVSDLLGELGDQEALESIKGLFEEDGALADILPEDMDIDGVLQTVGSQLAEAGSALNEGLGSVVEMVKEEAGSVDWEKAEDSVKELIDLIAGGALGDLVAETDEEAAEEEDWEAWLEELMIPYQRADAVMFDYVAERNAEFMDAGDAQVFSKMTGYMDDPEQDEVRVLADFTQMNYAIDGDQMNMVSGATDTLLLTLTKGEDGTYTVTDEKHTEDGEGYTASFEALCEEVGIPADDFYASRVLGAYNDAEALAEYLNEHPEIKTAEYQGEQMTAQELQTMADDYTNELFDSIFGDESEEMTEGITE